jgi:hypothetical protein
MTKKIKVVQLLLLGLMSFLLIPIYSCSEPAYHGQMIPVYITFDNHTYENSGETVAKEKAPQNIRYIGQASLEEQTINESMIANEGYEVYAIQGIDKNTAVAIKILLVSEKDAYYFYFKYVRQL